MNAEYWPDKAATYVAVAAQFQAAILASEVAHQERANPRQAAQLGCDHAEAFIAEIERRGIYNFQKPFQIHE